MLCVQIDKLKEKVLAYEKELLKAKACSSHFRHRKPLHAHKRVSCLWENYCAFMSAWHRRFFSCHALPRDLTHALFAPVLHMHTYLCGI